LLFSPVKSLTPEAVLLLVRRGCHHAKALVSFSKANRLKSVSLNLFTLAAADSMEELLV
jgi:hypothetical protein